MSNLPPLNSIKAFEAAARLGNFVLAATELGVTSVAISQQVRKLESYFGKQLFIRTGNRITLTDAGQSIYPQTSRALGDLSAMSARIQERNFQGLLVISVPFSLADLWLAPKLAGLFETSPHLAIDIRVENDPIDFARHSVDLRVAYGGYHYPEMQVLSLFHDEVLPLCAPDFMQRQGNNAFDLSTVHESAFIHTHWGPDYASHPSWSEWFRKAGIDRQPNPARGRRVGLSSLAISAARSGLGIALAQREMARHDLKAGRLVSLSPVSLPLGHQYWAVTPTAHIDRTDIRRLIELLK